jgi:hypothetical protein
MSRELLAPSSPYRIPARVSPEPLDSLGTSQRVAQRLVVGWAILRVGVCTVVGVDLEGVLALVIVATAVKSLARSLA